MSNHIELLAQKMERQGELTVAANLRDLKRQNNALSMNEITIKDIKQMTTALHKLGCAAPESIEDACAHSRKLLLQLLRAVESSESRFVEGDPFWVLYDPATQLIKQGADDRRLAFYESEEDAIAAKKSNPDAEYAEWRFYRLSEKEAQNNAV